MSKYRKNKLLVLGVDHLHWAILTELYELWVTLEQKVTWFEWNHTKLNRHFTNLFHLLGKCMSNFFMYCDCQMGIFDNEFYQMGIFDNEYSDWIFRFSCQFDFSMLGFKKKEKTFSAHRDCWPLPILHSKTFVPGLRELIFHSSFVATASFSSSISPLQELFFENPWSTSRHLCLLHRVAMSCSNEPFEACHELCFFVAHFNLTGLPNNVFICSKTC